MFSQYGPVEDAFIPTGEHRCVGVGPTTWGDLGAPCRQWGPLPRPPTCLVPTTRSCVRDPARYRCGWMGRAARCTGGDAQVPLRKPHGSWGPERCSLHACARTTSAFHLLPLTLLTLPGVLRARGWCRARRC